MTAYGIIKNISCELERLYGSFLWIKFCFPLYVFYDWHFSLSLTSMRIDLDILNYYIANQIFIRWYFISLNLVKLIVVKVCSWLIDLVTCIWLMNIVLQWIDPHIIITKIRMLNRKLLAFQNRVWRTLFPFYMCLRDYNWLPS